MLDLIELRTLATMGPQDAYQIAGRLQRLSDQSLELSQGTPCPAFVRLEQYCWIKGTWGQTKNNREARFHELTPTGRSALEKETTQWRRMWTLVERHLVEGTRA